MSYGHDNAIFPQDGANFLILCVRVKFIGAREPMGVEDGEVTKLTS